MDCCAVRCPTRAVLADSRFGWMIQDTSGPDCGALPTVTRASALSTLEMVVLNGETAGDDRDRDARRRWSSASSKKSLLYDKNGEEHYNLISALHKSMRNSDPDAAVYWLARMLEAGEDPLYVARRLIRFASEDVGLADPHALEIAVAAYQACHLIGMPECTVQFDAGGGLPLAGAQVQCAVCRL